MVDKSFGTRDYWEKERVQTKNRLIDVNMHIDSLMEDVGELKSERDEIFKEYQEIEAELKDLDQKEERELHEWRLKNDMVYHAMHNPFQKKLVLG